MLDPSALAEDIAERYGIALDATAWADASATADRIGRLVRTAAASLALGSEPAGFRRALIAASHSPETDQGSRDE